MNESFATILYRNGIWIAIPLFLLSAVALGFFILNLVRLGAKTQLFSLPLAAEQTIEFKEAGKVVLSGEGPLFTSKFAKLQFELSAEAGAPLEGRTTWFHARRTDFSNVKLELMSYTIPRPGKYTLRIRNLEKGAPAETGHHIVFSKPRLIQTIGFILGIVLSAGLLIGSLVLFILRVTGKGDGA